MRERSDRNVALGADEGPRGDRWQRSGARGRSGPSRWRRPGPRSCPTPCTRCPRSWPARPGAGWTGRSAVRVHRRLRHGRRVAGVEAAGKPHRMAAVRDRPGVRRSGLRRVAVALSPDADPGQLAGLDVPAGHRAVRVRRAAVSHGAPALAPLAAGGLGRRGGPGRVGRGRRVRPHHLHGQPGAAEPGRRAQACRGHPLRRGDGRRPADRRHRPGRHRVPGVPLPARWDGRTRTAEVAGLRGRPDRGSAGRRGAARADHRYGHCGQQPRERAEHRGHRAGPAGHRRRHPALPAVRHRPDHLPDPGLRDRHRPADRDLRRPGAAGHPGARDPQRGSRGRRYPGRRRAVQPRAAAGAAPGGPALQPGPV